MIMIQGQIGKPGLIVAPSVTLTDTVDLGRPAPKFCKALLRGFEFVTVPENIHLRVIKVQLDTRFVNDLQHAEVSAEIVLQDDRGTGIDWRALEIVVHYTVIAD